MLFGNDVNGSHCVWCPDGPCITTSENQCEPKSLMEGQGLVNFESCLPGITLSKYQIHKIRIEFKSILNIQITSLIH